MPRAAVVINKTVFVLLLALIVLAAIPNGSIEPWSEALFECAVFAITAIWIFEVLLTGRWEIKRLFLLLPLILLTAYAFSQMLVWPVAWLPAGIVGRLTAQYSLSIDRYQTLLTARKALALTLFLGLLLIHTSTERRYRWLVRVVIGLGLASALFGILRQVMQSPTSQTPFLLPFLYYGFGYGQFVYHNAFAYLMEMSLAVTAGLVLGGAVRRNRTPIYLTIVVVLWTALVLSNSRGGIISLACQSVFLLFVSLSWYSSRRLARADGTQPPWVRFFQSSLWVRALAVALLVGTLIVAVFWMGGEELASRVQDPNQNTVDGLTRPEVWRSTLRLIEQNPWTGVGFGAYFLAIPQYRPGPGFTRLEQAHNDYLDLAANGGFVAVALAAWFIAMIIARARIALRSADIYRRAACLGALAGMLSIGVHSLVDFGLQVTGIALVFGALVVITVADPEVESAMSERNFKKRISRRSAVKAFPD
jgi:O-antigen ligase